MSEPTPHIAEVLGEPADAVAADARAADKAAPVARAGWLTRINYDPDQGNRAADFEVPAHEFARRFAVLEADTPPTGEEAEKYRVRLPGMTAQDAYLPMDVRGMIQEPVLERGRLVRWKPTLIESKRDLHAFHGSAAGRYKIRRESESADVRTLREALREDGFDTDNGDRMGGSTDAMRLMDTEFIPLSAGPFNKQLRTYDYLSMHARSFELTNHNAIAAAAIKIMTRFVLGRGISFHIKHPKANAVWTRFWDRNNMRTKMRQMARDLPWQGELMLRYYEHTRGRLDVRVMDPSTVWEIVTDVEDIEKVFYFHQMFQTIFQTWVTGQIPSTRYIIAQIPPTNIQHLKINCSAAEKRGRSDLLPAMAWFKRLNDYYNGVTVKALLEANLVWKVKVKGDLRDVQALSTDPSIAELPPPGGLWWENEQVDLQPVSATLTAARASSGLGGELVELIAASLNLPGEYFNAAAQRGGSSRATALVRTDPAVKTIEERQQLLRETLEEMYIREMAMALASGEIPPEAAREEPDHGADPDQEPNRHADEEDWLASRRAGDILRRATLAPRHAELAGQRALLVPQHAELAGPQRAGIASPQHGRVDSPQHAELVRVRG